MSNRLPKGMVPHARFRAELVDRAIIANQQQQEKKRHIDDDRFAAISDKVMQVLDQTPVETWTSQMWGAFRDLWKQRNKEPIPENQPPTTSSMSSAELVKLLNGSPSTSSTSPSSNAKPVTS